MSRGDIPTLFLVPMGFRYSYVWDDFKHEYPRLALELRHLVLVEQGELEITLQELTATFCRNHDFDLPNFVEQSKLARKERALEKKLEQYVVSETKRKRQLEDAVKDALARQPSPPSQHPSETPDIPTTTPWATDNYCHDESISGEEAPLLVLNTHIRFDSEEASSPTGDSYPSPTQHSQEPSIPVIVAHNPETMPDEPLRPQPISPEPPCARCILLEQQLAEANAALDRTTNELNVCRAKNDTLSAEVTQLRAYIADFVSRVDQRL